MEGEVAPFVETELRGNIMGRLLAMVAKDFFDDLSAKIMSTLVDSIAIVRWTRINATSVDTVASGNVLKLA